jgi:signal transduction histidine kinase
VRSFSMVGRVLPDAEASLWRALAVYRLLVLGYAVVVVSGHWRGYAHPLVGWLVVAAMAAWTLFCTWAYASRERRTWPYLAADLAVACAVIMSTLLVETAQHVREGAPTVPTFWASASMLAWAIRFGPVGGAAGAGALAAANLVVRADLTGSTLANIFLLFLTGIVVGYVADLVLAAEAERTRAAQLAAATAERERLARTIHDGVLQVLALVQRRGAEIGGDSAELGRLAGEQERILRALVAGDPAPMTTVDGPATVDLAPLLHAAVAHRPYATLAAPATPVVLTGHEASEVAAAAAEALDNVDRHAGAGARAWVLVEDDPEAVTVTVRDDGVGVSADRLAVARAEGRLGVAHTIVGRMRDLGGHASITSVVGQGTEVELRLPRSRRAASGPPIVRT